VTARRASRRAPPKAASARRRFLALAAVALVVLGVTFVAGASVHRWWPSRDARWAASSGWKHWLGLAPRKSAAEAVARDKTHADRAEPAAPVLTFYHELTAPLVPTPPPPRPKPAGGTVVVPVTPLTPNNPGATPERDPAAPGGRFTVQVGAYRTREGAESLRARLSGSGLEVHIVESPVPDGVRYRVQVGSFLSAEEARAAAAKLAGTRQVATYVTTR